MRLTIDASVAVKWFVPEPGFDRARNLIGQGDELLAPDIVLPEIFNALWRRAKTGLSGPIDPELCLRTARRAFTDLTPSLAIVDQAARLAGRYNHSVYDCLYLATADRSGGRLVTADIKLAKVAERASIECVIL